MAEDWCGTLRRGRKDDASPLRGSAKALLGGVATARLISSTVCFLARRRQLSPAQDGRPSSWTSRGTSVHANRADDTQRVLGHSRVLILDDDRRGVQRDRCSRSGWVWMGDGTIGAVRSRRLYP